jgi:hypothetical protein
MKGAIMAIRTARGPSAATAKPDNQPATSWLDRVAPLSGVVFAVLAMGGYLTIDEFPDSDTPVSTLTSYYAAHHVQVARGGMLLAYSVIFFILFGVAVWARIRRSAAHPVLAGVVLVATAVNAAEGLNSAGTYAMLGDIGAEQATTPGALQAWHIFGAIGHPSVDMLTLLLAVAAAGILARAFPRWLAWSALVLVALHFTPFSFVGILLFHLWVLLAGIALAVRPGVRIAAPTQLEPSGALPHEA